MAEIGSTLREARMRARIDISEVEAQTKIRAKYLRALENEEWDLLPGSVYVKSFLKTYGNYLGVDSRLLVDEFKRRYERPSDHDQRVSGPVAAGGRASEHRERASRNRSPRSRGASRGGGLPLPGRGLGLNLGRLMSPPFVIGGVLIAIVVALLVISSLNKGNNSGGSGVGAGTGVTTSQSTTSTPKTDTTTTKKQKHKRRPATLAIVPTAAIYVCVKTAAGKQLLVGTYAPGQTVPTTKAKTLHVTLGNANATVKVNGKPYTLTPSSTPIGLAITRSGVKPLSPGPTCA